LILGISSTSMRVATLGLLALSLSACSAHSQAPATPSAVQQPGPTTARINATRLQLEPGTGVPIKLTSGWAASQLNGERSRQSHLTQLPAVAPLTISAAASSVRTTLATTGTSALVLYDITGTWGYLGELYAMAAANLAGHFGSVKTEPIDSYTSGQLNQYTAAVYVGSTYGEPIPTAFYADVASSTTPVLWINDNIWSMANAIGPATFETKYGWDPTNSYFAPNGSVGNVTQVTYKTEPLTRTIPAGFDGGVLHPYIMGGTYPAVTTLAQAVDSSTSPATTFPWAIRSGNLTYIGEVPFDYMSGTDRIIAFQDLLFDALAPSTATRHRALVRLEDINPGYDSTDITSLTNIATWLYNNKIPYAFGVVPVYTDPRGCNNGGKAKTVTLAQNAALVTELKWMVAHGGTIVDHGYTHQYSNVNDPYDGVTTDDAEFFIAKMSPSNNQTCGVDTTDTVTWTGPVPGDSASWARSRFINALAGFSAVGLSKPTIFEFPHYAASAADYVAVKADYAERYERAFYFNGVLSGGAINGSSFIGQFFPYVVTDVYGGKVLPENLGNYEPLASNGNPPHTPAQIVATAQDNLAVRDGFASFFFHPYYYAAGQPDGTSGVTDFQQIITGIQGLGYTFVSPTSL
jgi:uncharacterized protein YdaL